MFTFQFEFLTRKVTESQAWPVKLITNKSALAKGFDSLRLV
jgi:hypothetical protein